MNPIISIRPLGFQWGTADPFIFCVHHEDYYPAGDEQLGVPDTLLKGRMIGEDFAVKDGFRMYHGQHVPGFPGHPHRGFETITIVRKGMVDHSDSLGAAGRYGDGDVQWMTAGNGLQHSEMFPLLKMNEANTAELFQIWLNLPKKSKSAAPHFKMFWKEKIPTVMHKDATGKQTTIEVIAGKLGDTSALMPPPDSWAADPSNDVAVWIINMEAGAHFTLPKASADINRNLYVYEGAALQIEGQDIAKYSAVQVQADHVLSMQAGEQPIRILLLQGKPIDETVVQYGPFVMNSKEEINQAYEEFRRTQFGGWPWPSYDHVHDRNKGRFALYEDGKEEFPPVNNK